MHDPSYELPQEPRRLLLVEDDDGDALIVQELLADSMPELDIERARRVAEAERAVGAEIDCVVLDLGLPDAIGLEAVRRIRAVDEEMPVVVLTGDSDEERGVHALAVGAQDYLVKGAITSVSLSRAIRHSVQRKLAERTQRELAVLRIQTAENARVQSGLLPQPIVEDPRIAVGSAYRPGNRRLVLGGDFYDLVEDQSGCLHAMLGDVCGHGPDEAALGVRLRIAWRTLILAGAPSDQVLGTLDRVLTQERHESHLFVTLATVTVDLASGVATVRLAGHPPPILLDAAGPRPLSGRTGEPPLGLAAAPDWTANEVQIGDHWSLLLYSDGIYEGHVPGGSRLGIDGLLGLLADGEAFDTAAPEGLIERVEQLNGGPLEDDVALLALTCNGDC